MDINQLSEEYFKNLSSHFINTASSQVLQRITNRITEVINDIDIKSEVDRLVASSVDRAVKSYSEPQIGTNLVTGFKKNTDDFLQELAFTVKSQVIDNLNNRLSGIDITALITDHTNNIVHNSLRRGELTFPDHSIQLRSLDLTDLQLGADKIGPGIIKNFESTGIQDQATDCRLTIRDDAVVVENKLIAKDLDVRGTISFSNFPASIVENIANRSADKVRSDYSSGMFDTYMTQVINKIDEQGLDANKVKVNSVPIVSNGRLAPGVIFSNLQHVGALRELRVIGESLLDDSLYAAGGRVGINTIEPMSVLDVWDQEVQLMFSKKQKDTGFFGTGRSQRLVLGTNQQNQLSLETDGSVQILRLNIGRVHMTSGPWQPTDNRQVGEIVWNEQPQVGQPIGWVSLGGARWAKFGIITD